MKRLSRALPAYSAVLVVLIVIPLLAEAASEEALSDIKSLLLEAYASDQPGAAVLIKKDGQVIHHAGYGMASLELGVSVTPDTVFRIGSVTKQFTAAGIMLLQEQGKLSISDPITKYLPEYPTHGHNITIEHLLTHTSGIMSYTSIPGYMAGNEIRHDVSTEELIDVFENLPMKFVPGTQWRYSNSGYVLLGAIIEVVSEERYAEFIDERVARPLNLQSTTYGGFQLVPNRAAGYDVDDDGSFVNADFLSMTQPHGAGALLSTVGDLAAWNDALVNGKLISKASYEQMIKPYELANGEPYPYGYGLAFGPLRGRSTVFHGGGIHGFSCYTLWLPQEDVYIAVLTNSTGRRPGPGTVARRAAAILIGDPYPNRIPVQLDPTLQARLVGKYAGQGFPPVEISVGDGGLVIHIGDFLTGELLVENRETLFTRDSLTYFEVEWDGDSVSKLLVHATEGKPPVLLEPVEE